MHRWGRKDVASRERAERGLGLCCCTAKTTLGGLARRRRRAPVPAREEAPWPLQVVLKEATVAKVASGDVGIRSCAWNGFVSSVGLGSSNSRGAG